MSEIKLYLNEDHSRYICEYGVLTTLGHNYREALEKMNGLMKILCEYDFHQYNKFFDQYLINKQKDLEPEFAETVDKHFWDMI